MAKNNVVVRTAADLEKKYNFAALLGLKKNVELTAQGIAKIENELNSMLNALVINLKDVLDSQSEISLWFYPGIPTKENLPYTSWTTPKDHIGDIYYDQSSGYVYQFNDKEIWEVNTDANLVEAMAITNAEIDTTQDHERKVFFDTPSIPYSNGDWWIKGDGDLFICQISKTTGTYEETDFIDSSNYTESIAEKLGEEIKVLKGTITMISENYAKFTDLATGGSTIISGDNITTGNIQSKNYVKDVSGTKIALENGEIDSKNFKVNSTGDVTMNNANVIGGKINLTDEGQTHSDPRFAIGGTYEGHTYKSNLGSDGVYFWKDGIVHYAEFGVFNGEVGTGGYMNLGCLNGSSIELYSDDEKAVGCFSTKSNSINIDSGGEDDGNPYIQVFKNDVGTSISSGGVWAASYNNTSLEETKKNINSFKSNALELIKNTELYEFNYKNESDEDKKHIGIVIGENYKYPTEILSNDGKGVDLYSMVSLCFKAIQEQQEIIDQQRKEIEILKEG